MDKERLNTLTQSIIGAALEVHRELGPGLLEPVHSAQLLSYLKFADCRVGLLFNFNVKWLTQDGLKRVVNGFPE